ncbi:MAG: copper chaperone PCu(A)C [Pseudomonadota bacterium]
MKTYFLAALIVIMGTFSAFAGKDGVSVKDPWVRLAPPSATVNAAYMKVHNGSKKERSIVSAKSPLFKKVELHYSKVKDGVATMEQLAQVTIPAGKMVALKPGGLHVMLIGPNKDIKTDMMVPITLTFANGQTLKVKAPVKKKHGKAGKKEHKGSHHH